MKLEGESEDFFEKISQVISINFMISMIKMLIHPANNDGNLNYFKKWDKFEILFYVMKVISKFFIF